MVRRVEEDPGDKGVSGQVDLLAQLGEVLSLRIKLDEMAKQVPPPILLRDNSTSRAMKKAYASVDAAGDRIIKELVGPKK